MPNKRFEWDAPTAGFAACFRAPQAKRSSALRADERARVVPNSGFSARSAVEPSLERHPFGATSSSRTRVTAAHHDSRNFTVHWSGGGSAPCGMALNSRPLALKRFVQTIENF